MNFIKRIKKLKYKNDAERASVLKDYSDATSEPGKKKLFGGTRLINWTHLQKIRLN